MTTDEIGVLILAAGSSSRMGMSKQMLPINGTSLLARTIKTTIEANLKNIAVVLGSNADEHRIAANEFPVTTVLNHGWKNGMGTSIRVGIHHFRPIDSIKGVIILVCDQPTLQPEILIKLIENQKQTGKSIIACRYANTVGVPALFSRTMFDELTSLEDNHGAKQLILEHPNDVSTIDFPSGEIDLDTPEDYDNFIKSHQS